MSAADLIAQATVLVLFLIALQHRDLIADLSDGNVERLVRVEAEATEAQWWLEQMGAGK